jgi:tetratricopeptide (TPR) repeat protein
MHRTLISAGILGLVLVGCGSKKEPAPATQPTASVDEPDTPDAEPKPKDQPKPTAAASTGPDVVALKQQVNDAAALLTVENEQSARRALEMLKEVKSKDPSIAEAHFNIGVAQQQLGNLGAARMAFENAVERDKTLGNAWLGLGVVQEQSGELQFAYEKYVRGVENDPDNAQLRTAIINVLRRQNKLDDAVRAGREALNYNATSVEIYTALGRVYVERNDLAMARFVYQQAQTVPGSESNAALKTNLARVLYLQGDTAIARQEFQESLKLDGEHLPTLVYLTELYLDDHNYTDARPLLEIASNKAPDNHGLLLNLGVAYRGSGDMPNAVKTYEKALELDPTNPDPHLNLGILYGDYNKDYDRAVKSFNAYIEGGGQETERVEGYIKRVERERKRAEKLQKAGEERKQREQERLERQRLLEEAEKKQAQEDARKAAEDAKNAPAPAPEEGADWQGNETPPAPETPETPPAEGGGWQGGG